MHHTNHSINSRAIRATAIAVVVAAVTVVAAVALRMFMYLDGGDLKTEHTHNKFDMAESNPCGTVFIFT